MDWRIKDNLTMALNYLNRRIAKNSCNTIDDKSVRLYSMRDIKPIFMLVMKKQKLDPLQSSIYIKEKFKSGQYLKLINEEIAP